MANVNKIDLKNNGYANISYSEVFGSFSSARNETNGSYGNWYKSSIKGGFKSGYGKNYSFQRQYFEFPKLNTNRTIKRAFFVSKVLKRPTSDYVARQEWDNGNSFNEYCDISLIESTDSASSYNSNMSSFPGFTTNKLVSKSEANRIYDSNFDQGQSNLIRIELNDYIISKLTNKSNTICLVQHQDYENNPDMIGNVDSEYKLELLEPEITYIEIEYEPYVACTGEGILLSSEVPNQVGWQWYTLDQDTPTVLPFFYGDRMLVTEQILSENLSNTSSARVMLHSYDPNYIITKEIFDVIFNSCPTKTTIYPNSIRGWKETNGVPISTVRKINDAESFGANLNKTPNSLTDKTIDTSPGYAVVISGNDLMTNYNDPENDNPKYIKFYSQDTGDSNEDIGVYYWSGGITSGWVKITPSTQPLSFPRNIRVKDNGTTNGRSKSFRYKVTDVGTPDHRYSTATGTITVNIGSPNLPPSQLTNITKSMDYNKSIKFKGAELQVDYNDPDGDKAKEFRFSNFNNQGIKLEYWSGSNWVEVNSLNNTAPGASTPKGFRDFRTRCDGSVSSPKSHTFKYKVKDVGSNQFSSVEGEIKINVNGGLVVSDKFTGSGASTPFQSNGCNLTANTNYWISSMPIGVGKTVYTNSSKTSRLNGNNYYYKLGSSSFKVDSNGKISGIGYLCT